MLLYELGEYDILLKIPLVGRPVNKRFSHMSYQPIS
jgi:hypothetical protein